MRCTQWSKAGAAAAALCVLGVALAACGPQLPTVQLPPPIAQRTAPLGSAPDTVFARLGPVLGRYDLAGRQRLIVSASPKVELILVVAGLASDWSLLNNWSDPLSLSLRDSAQAHFGPYRDHPAVRALSRLRSKHGFWFDALPKLALAYTDPPSLDQIYPISDYLRGRVEGDERALRELMVYLRDFAAVSDFAGWWQRHASEYGQIEAACRDLYLDVDPLGDIEGYFGGRLAALVVIPSGLMAGGFGGLLEDPDGDWALNCLGPITEARLPGVGGLELLAIHEGGHAFVNPATDEHPALVSKYATLFAPIASDMRRQHYGNWPIALNEHILRAAHARIYLQTNTFYPELLKALDQFR